MEVVDSVRSNVPKVIVQKNKRNEINKKISNRLKGYQHSDEMKQKLSLNNGSRRQEVKNNISKSMLKYFKTDKGRKHKEKLRELGYARIFTEETRRKLSKIKSLSNSKGISIFYSIPCKFYFNNTEIRCDSKKEFECLTKVCELYNVLNINRCNFVIEYEYKNKIRYFNPDFKIITSDFIMIVECKANISKNKTNKEFRPHYFLTIEDKKRSLIKYCNHNHFIPYWFDGKLVNLNRTID